MTNRRSFIKQVSAAGIVSSIPSVLFSQPLPNPDMIWANLIHLSYNEWEDNTPLKYKDDNYQCKTCQEAREWAHGFRSTLTFDDSVWNAVLKEMVAVGMNMIVIDLGDGIQYESHPEIAANNAWTTEKLKKELIKIRKMGLEPIPKLNFATTHDTWMKKYSRMVSSDIYYGVCKDLIEEVSNLFNKPRFFHLGMDEENAENQRRSDYAVIRQNDLWWGDLYFFISEVERNGIRPWVWSDYAWYKPEVFYKKMPKSVLQSNWYYGANFNVKTPKDKKKLPCQFYDELDAHGYDQIPTGSNHSIPENFEMTVDYCKKVIAPSRLSGFMTAPWRPTLELCLNRHIEAIRQVGRAMNKF